MSKNKLWSYARIKNGNYSEPSPKIMSALPEKAEVNASKALMPCLLPVLMNDISLT